MLDYVETTLANPAHYPELSLFLDFTRLRMRRVGISTAARRVNISAEIAARWDRFTLEQIQEVLTTRLRHRDEAPRAAEDDEEE